MLDQTKFSKQMDIIKENFGGEKNFTTSRCALIFKEMNRYEDIQFKRTVEYLVIHQFKPPTIDDFKKAMEYVLEQERLAERAKINSQVASNWKDPFEEIGEWENVDVPIKCEHCFDTGTLTATDRKTKNDHFFRCFCEAGEKRPLFDGPIFSKKYWKYYSIPRPPSSPQEEVKEILAKSESKWRDAELERQKNGFKGPTFRLMYGNKK